MRNIVIDVIHLHSISSLNMHVAFIVTQLSVNCSQSSPLIFKMYVLHVKLICTFLKLRSAFETVQ